MTTITFVAGMRGVGKRTLLETLAKGSDYSSPNDWDVCGGDLIGRAKKLLRQTMKIVCPNLKQNSMPVNLVLGAPTRGVYS